MKRFLIILCMIAIGAAHAQSTKRAMVPADQRDLGLQADHRALFNKDRASWEKAVPLSKAGFLIDEEIIGDTRYDKQTNHSNQHRINLYGDGTIGAAWIMGFSEINSFPDRGTGYNYFDGTGWGTKPTTRLETMRCGWPSYSDFGSNGELIVSHSTVAAIPGLALLKRDVKGSGSWNQSMLTGPPGHHEISWPRAITAGTDNKTIHILATTDPSHNGGSPYMGIDGCPVYYRSNNGGSSWEVEHHLFPEMDSSHYTEYSSDCYAWANPVGNTIAFAVGSKWTDLFIMKSDDGGLNWTKKLVFQHPYPNFDWNTTIITDTITVCDGAISIALDSEGKAHVFFGLMRVNHDTPGDEYTFFPYTDGLAYWNEDMATLTHLDADSLYDMGCLPGYCVDYNGNDTLDLIWGLEGLGKYVLSMSGMPTVTIDEQDRIFVLYSSLMENFDDGAQNYRHLMARASLDKGLTWVDTIVDLTGGIIHNYDECIFPSLSPTSNDFIHYVYQADDEPGIAISGDEDLYTDNSIIYGYAAKSDFILTVPEVPSMIVPQSINVFPNPFRNQVIIGIKTTRTDDISLYVHNITGQEIFSLRAGRKDAGNHQITVDGNDWKPGMYFLTIYGGDSSVSKKILKQ